VTDGSGKTAEDLLPVLSVLLRVILEMLLQIASKDESVLQINTNESGLIVHNEREREREAEAEENGAAAPSRREMRERRSSSSSGSEMRRASSRAHRT
jgi:hypothetical protein